MVEEIVPFFGVPEGLLSDRGTNLLSHLMMDICKLLGVNKLNTTAYHPECDGMVERFNRTLKSMLRKQAARYGNQWDRFLPGVLWAYRNTPHESTGEKPSFLLFGVDLRFPTEAALLPTSGLKWTDTDDYREEMISSLSSARSIATQSIKRAQEKYKEYFDRRAQQKDYRIGDQVLVRFPQEEQGQMRKLSQPWHGPYRVVSCDDPDITVVKVYYPQEGQIRIHQSRVCPCPKGFPPGYFWYGSRRHAVGRPPKWIINLLKEKSSDDSSLNTPDGPMDISDNSSLNAPDGPMDMDVQKSKEVSEVSDSCNSSDSPHFQRNGSAAKGRYHLQKTRRDTVHSGRAESRKGVM